MSLARNAEAESESRAHECPRAADLSYAYKILLPVHTEPDISQDSSNLSKYKPRLTHILSVTKLKMKSALAIIMSLAFASVFAAAVPIDSGTQ